ncbi:NADPH-dependent F420 reductase [Pseudomaricurvus alkylphenolicus]|uniref:NADPH-dependent F420 reductase n=1 Tax=Pseudomaricurvus alkylphenolicus TaxID=1306991 RepID=UPI001423E5B8|nr:NADPH-dependent F420 reductase [Pseudomaricurvus alkylphenolicus]NIB38842.1 NADPH-dependent F420 reductase [Pseudomaricurvus alkylphenolicus]
MTDTKPILAILGGTGDLGGGLARRWIEAGYQVIIGSRTLEKAEEVVASLAEKLEIAASLTAKQNKEAAASADVVVLTVPFAHQAATLEQVREALIGKILIDVTVPLVPPKVARVELPAQGSAGQIAQELLGEEVRVVSAFQNVAALHLQSGGQQDCDVLVCGNNKEARAEVISLVEACGLRGFHAGPINNAAAVEAMTSLLIFINKQYKAHTGIRITGLQG